MPPLMPDRLRRPALGAALLAWLVAASLAAQYAGGTAAGPLDRALTGAVRAVAGPPGLIGEILVFPTTPALVYAALVAVLVVEVVRRRWWWAGLVVTGPTVAIVLTEAAFKPLDGRTHNGFLSYPSGHTVSAVSAYLVMLLVLTTGRSRTVRLAGCGALLVLTVVLATGLVAMDYHYPTDTIGGFCVAVGVILPAAVLTDALSARPARPATTQPAGTPHEGTSSGSRSRAIRR
jgi:membrane-associated phospholipid phosphatase